MKHKEPDFTKELKKLTVVEYLKNVCGVDLNIKIREYYSPANILLEYINGTQ